MMESKREKHITLLFFLKSIAIAYTCNVIQRDAVIYEAKTQFTIALHIIAFIKEQESTI